jgi:hypothetical protein
VISESGTRATCGEVAAVNPKRKGVISAVARADEEMPQQKPIAADEQEHSRAVRKRASGSSAVIGAFGSATIISAIEPGDCYNGQ